MSDLVKEFEQQTRLKVRQSVLATKYTTFHIGGPFKYFIEVDSIEGLSKSIKVLNQMQQAYLILGFGSNLLVADEGVSKWVVKLGQGLKYYDEVGNGSFKVGASMPLMTLSSKISQAGYSGLEFAGGIPGSLGGAIRMNAGAHGVEMANLLDEVSVVNKEGDLVTLHASDLEFSYRDSSLSEMGVIVSAKLKLARSDAEQVLEQRSVLLKKRKETQPLQFPSAGSVFKNPSVDNPAGLLIDKAGLKGKKIGGAEISEQHANWIVNRGKEARAEDVHELIKLCKDRVFQEFEVLLNEEIICWNDD